MFDTNGKLIIPTLAENMDAYQKLYKDMFGLVDIDPSSALGSDLAITAEMKKIADEFIQHAFMQNSPFEAIDDGLDNLCFLRGIERKKDEHSVVLLEFSGTDGIIIGKNSPITNSVTNEVFLTNERGEISGGKYQVYATSLNAGRVICDAGTITQTAIAGVTVTNVSDGILGYLIESNTDLRKRLFTYANALNVDEELYIKLLNLKNVKYVNIISNYELVADPNGIPAKSTAIIVLGGDDVSISKEIFRTVPADKKTFGDTSLFVSSDVSKKEYLVSFSRPIPQSVTLDITITADSTFNLDDVGVIRASILSYFEDNFTISKDVLINALYIPIQQDYNSSFSPFKGITSVSLSLDGASNNVPMAFNKYAVLSSDNLTLTVV